MSADENTERSYTYEVSDKMSSTVRRVCGADADAVLKKLRKGAIVSRGPHTFKARKSRVLPKPKPPEKEEGAAGNPEEAKTSAPSGGSVPPKGGKDK